MLKIDANLALYKQVALEPPSSVSAVAGAIIVHDSAKPKDISDGRKITAVTSQRRCDIA